MHSRGEGLLHPSRVRTNSVWLTGGLRYAATSGYYLETLRVARIVDRSFRAVPILGESFQAGAKIGRLRLSDTASLQVHARRIRPGYPKQALEFVLESFDSRAQLDGPLPESLGQTRQRFAEFRCTHEDRLTDPGRVVRSENSDWQAVPAAYCLDAKFLTYAQKTKQRSTFA
jgi:hypothetical protein